MANRRRRERAGAITGSIATSRVPRYLSVLSVESDPVNNFDMRRSRVGTAGLPFRSLAVLSTPRRPRSFAVFPSLSRYALAQLFLQRVNVAPRFSRSVAVVSSKSSQARAYCVARSVRRGVLFASNVAGSRGVGRGKRRRTNLFSQYSC